ncbi:hypothetical protein Plec18170_007854 [Paecilomyces lecythidis]
MDVVSDTASLAALLQLATNVIHYVKSVINAPKIKRKLLTALIQARGLLSTLVDLTQEVEDEDWSHTIQNLSIHNGPLSVFQDILEKIARKLGVTTPGLKIPKALNRLLWPFDQTNLQEMLASLEKLKTHFLLAIANDHMRLSIAIRNDLHEIHNKLNIASIDTQRRTIVSLSREQEIIVNSLAPRNLSSELDGDEVMKLKVGAKWLLEHNDFKKWHEASDTQRLLVIIGIPGSGKSSISRVTEFFLKAWHRSEVDVCVAYFAFHFAQKERLNKSLVLSHIVQQMLSERPYLMEHVAALRLTGGPLSSRESIDLICRARGELKQLYLILDGLDEVENACGNLVEDLLTINPPLNILITARPTPVVRDAFQDSDVLHLTSALTFPCHLEAVIKTLEEVPRIAGYLDHNEVNIANVAKVIVKKSNGSWTFTTSMIKSLAQAETRAIFERLLGDSPRCLVETYELIFGKVTHQPVAFAALGKKTLRIMFEAACSTSANQLRSVLESELRAIRAAQNLSRNLTEGEIFEACITSCKGFVVSVGMPGEAERRLQIIHLSAKVFLETHGIPE